MHPDAKLNFDRAAQALGLDPATRDLAWRRMMDIGLTPDDPTVVYLAVGGLLEQAARTIPAALDAVPERVERAAARAVGPVAAAASARVEAAHAALAERTGEAVAASASEHFRRMERTGAREVGLWAAAIVLGCGLAAGGAGYWLGRRDTLGLDARWAGLSQRPDAPAWLALVAANPDLRAQISRFCAPSQLKLDTTSNRRYCELPLWTEGTVAPVGGLPETIALTLRDWLIAWGPAWLMLAAGLGALFTRRVLRRLIGWRPVAWLLE
ncbi:hypothetical protein SR39_30050 [Methylobacterium radiotolerans]|jgi:hypothetical protein|uniref:hypothetical protein n=1 Tax=Methylobacterium sp. 092160098-2 TaxID=3025129 RepID=UPI0005BD452B|nr:hypothetical protein [Methylobacterium sp. 092160098-2]KIU27406.1 hypothetical protein SR39_30050 [Methylobacterium radiotolerans]MDE4916235.1 hypothetical protein [Methylobacterium sp. 092160098-2]